MRTVFLLFFFCFCLAAHAQVVGRLFYNKEWKLTRRDSAVFFRVVVIDTANQAFVGPVKDFTKDGKVIMTGNYAGGKRNGAFIGYNRSGIKEWEGEYMDGVRAGLWHYYHRNGNKRTTIGFERGYARIIEHVDTVGNALFQNGKGRWSERYPESPDTYVTISGSFVSDQPDGTWTWSLDDGTVWCSTDFKKGQFENGYIIADGQRFELTSPPPLAIPDHFKHQYTEQFATVPGLLQSEYPFIKQIDGRDEIFSIVEVSAHPVGGMEAFYKEVSRLLLGKYPPDARRYGIEGRVFIQFIIEKDGTLRDFKVIKGVHPSLDELALDVVEMSQLRVKWVPGIQRRSRVRQKYTLPIIFKLG